MPSNSGDVLRVGLGAGSLAFDAPEQTAPSANSVRRRVSADAGLRMKRPEKPASPHVIGARKMPVAAGLRLRVSQNRQPALYALRWFRSLSFHSICLEDFSMNKLLPALMLCAFALVQVPAHAQAAKSATAAAPAASAASSAKAGEKKAEKAPAKKEKKGGC
jgi:hypothetical protein